MALTLPCGQCGQILGISVSMSGLLVRCPKCNATTRVPAETAKEPEVIIAEIAPISLPPHQGDEERRSERPPSRKSKPARVPSRSTPPLVWIAAGLVGVAALVGVPIMGACWFFFWRAGNVEPDWVPFTDPAGRFSVLLPGTPIPKEQPVAGQPPMKCYVVALKNTVFQVSSLAGSVNNMPVQARLAQARDGGLRAMAGAILESDNEITFANHPGRQFVVRNPKKTGRMVTRLIVARNRFYMLMIAGEAIHGDHPDVAKFFDSFKLEADASDPAPAELEPRDAGNGRSRVYLWDLQEIELDTSYRVDGGPRPFYKNGLLNDRLPARRVLVANKIYSKGLSTHPPEKWHSAVAYRLERKAKVFHSRIGIVMDSDDEKAEPPASPLTWRVLGDGETIWTSKPMQKYDMTEECCINVENVNMLELQVHCPGSSDRANACWLDPSVIIESESAVKSLAPPPDVIDFMDGTRTWLLTNDAPRKTTNMAWTAKGDAFFVVQSDGLVRRYSFPSRKLEREINRKQPTNICVVSGEGLLVTDQIAREIWLLDLDTLAVKRKYPVPAPNFHGRVLHSAPNLDFALFYSDGELYKLELRSGKLDKLGKTSGNQGKMTNDGKYYFAVNKDFRLGRFQIGPNMVEDRTSAVGSTPDRCIAISPDSKMVALLVQRFPETRWEFEVFDVDDLKHAKAKIPANDPWIRGSFDLTHKLFYTGGLIVHDMNGKRLKGFRPTGRNDERVYGFVIHPAGGNVLVLTDERIVLVELPEILLRHRNGGKKG